MNLSSISNFFMVKCFNGYGVPLIMSIILSVCAIPVQAEDLSIICDYDQRPNAWYENYVSADEDKFTVKLIACKKDAGSYLWELYEVDNSDPDGGGPWIEYPAGSYNYQITLPFGMYGVMLTVDGYNDGAARYINFSDPNSIEVLSVTSKFNEGSYFLYGIDHDVTYTAEVDWGENEPDIIRFITQSGTYDVLTSGATAEKTFNMGKDFASCSDLKVIAIAKNGEQSEEKKYAVNVMAPILTIPSFILVEDEGDFIYKANLSFTLDLLNLEEDANEAIQKSSDDYTKGLAGSYPPLFKNNTKFKLNFAPKIGTELTSKGNANFEFEVGSANLETKRLIKGKIIGLDFNLTPKLAFENRFDCISEKWIWTKSSIGISGEFEVGPPPWYWIIPLGPVPVPVYVKLKARVSGDGLINFAMEPEAFQPENGSLDVGLFARGAVGAGVCGILGVEGFAEGGGHFIFGFNPNPYTDEIKGLVKVGVAVYGLVWKWEPELPLKWEWSSKDSRFRTLSLSQNISEISFKPRLLSRDYLNHLSHSNFRSLPASLSNNGPIPVQTNIFPHSDANISGVNNMLYAVWVTDNSARNSVNRTMAVFSIYNGTEWSGLKSISDDGTADFHPELLTCSNNRAFAAWEDTKRVLSDDAQFEDMTKQLEISVSEYEPQTQNWINTKRITTNDYLDRSPKLAGKTSDDAILIWISNESNDIVGGSVNPNKLLYSQYLDNKWKEPKLIAEIPYPILRYGAVYDGNKGYIVLGLDTDNDVVTIEDHELFLTEFDKENGVWGNLIQLTDDALADDNPQLGITPDAGIILTWLKNGELSSVVDFDMNSRKILRSDMDGYSGNLAEFRLASSNDGKLAMVWTEPSTKNGSDIHALFYDFISNRWGETKQLTNDAEAEFRMAASFYDNDTLAVLYNRKMLGDNVSSDTDIYMIKYPVQEDDFLKEDPSPDEMLGDINGDGIVNISDAILALKILCGYFENEHVNIAGDVNGDKKIGLAETVYILREISEVK